MSGTRGRIRLPSILIRAPLGPETDSVPRNLIEPVSASSTSSTLGAGFGRTGNAGQILGMPVWIAQSPYMGAAMLGDDVALDASKGILAVADFESSSTNNNDIVYGYAIHESALYYAFSKQAKITASYRHAYLSTLVTCESAYGGAFRNTDADGNRRCFALIDYKAA